MYELNNILFTALDNIDWDIPQDLIQVAVNAEVRSLSAECPPADEVWRCSDDTSYPTH